MGELNPGPEREYLQFKNAALDAFGFMVPDYGFRCTKISPLIVRFESEYVYFEVTHEPRSFEIDFSVGRIDRPDERFSLSELNVFMGYAEEGKSYPALMAYKPEAVKEVLAQVGDHLKDKGGSVLQGRADAFEKLASIRASAPNDYFNGVHVGSAKKAAEDAFHAKDYGKVVKALEPIKGCLSQAELKKLDYAKRHSG